MRNIGKITNMAGAFLLTLALLCTTCISAAAATATTEYLDFSKSGCSSISITLKDSDGNPVTDGVLTLYQVATLYLDDGSMSYTLTEAFEDSGIVPDLITESSETLVKYAEELRTYTQQNNTPGLIQSNTAGTVTFSGLELGLYLVVQTAASAGYESADPFIVSVPLADEDGWIYDVDASPKMDLLREEIPEEEAGPETPDEPVEPEMPATSETSVTLAQTGQLNWPIPVLCAAGTVCVLFGIVLTAGDNRRKRTNAA